MENNPNRVIFLDIDGVMVPGRVFFLPENQGDGVLDPSFDPIAVAMLNRMIDRTGAQIVMCSTWAYVNMKRSRTICARTLKKNGVHTHTLHQDWSVYDYADEREPGIENWLRVHPEVTHHAILDDSISEEITELPIDFSDGMTINTYIGAMTRLGVPDSFLIL